ncbi:MAG: SsrA-binding protein SmpB [Proteobacteria bacterium]|nr:SsrA-binding protein SmpB [Pseudomonadota bacterium]
MKKPVRDPVKLIARNKAASHNYELLEKFEAGLVLTGSEVKSLRMGKANLKNAFGHIKNGEVWLKDCHIAEYPFATHANHHPERERKLLLHKREIKRLIGQLREKGLSLIPLRLYFRDSRVKVELALAKGKKAYDKRQDIKRRESERDIARQWRRGSR